MAKPLEYNSFSIKARKDKKAVFTSLAHIKETWKMMNRKGASGVDGETTKEFELNLDERVEDIWQRMKEKRYKAPPVRRVEIPKSKGKTKGTVFVGANASGKSNALLAIRLLLDLLFMEKEINSGIFACLFSDKPEFSLDYYFKIDDKEIRYYFEFDAKKTMLSEKLYIDNKVLLERMGITAKLYVADKENYSDLDEETLFLRTVYLNTKFAGNEILSKWFDFLQGSIYINAFDKNVISYGKQDFRITKYVEEKGTEEINQFFQNYDFDQVIDYANEAEGDHMIIRYHKDEEKMVFFKRKGINTIIPYDEESVGNRTLLNLLPAFLFVAQHNGMLLIDDFSNAFHNDVTRQIFLQ